jgi:aspartate dehydrogenase
MTTFGIVGWGRIGRRIASRLANDRNAPKLCAYLVRPHQRDEAEAELGPGLACDRVDELIARRPDVVVESASPPALADLAPHLLGTGIDVIPLSLAAFADPAVEAEVLAAARAGPGRLEIPAGAVGSLGFLAAAREDALSDVLIRAAYPPARLLGTKAEGMADVAAITSRQVIFSGSVRELAAGFPRRVNVTVAVALAGLGLDRTRAELVADPALTQATFDVELRAGPGDARLSIGPRDVPLGADPVDYTTFSVIRLLRRRVARVMV